MVQGVFDQSVSFGRFLGAFAVIFIAAIANS
jgi:hypothetical protein